MICGFVYDNVQCKKAMDGQGEIAIIRFWPRDETHHFVLLLWDEYWVPNRSPNHVSKIVGGICKQEKKVWDSGFGCSCNKVDKYLNFARDMRKA